MEVNRLIPSRKHYETQETWGVEAGLRMKSGPSLGTEGKSSSKQADKVSSGLA